MGKARESACTAPASQNSSTDNTLSEFRVSISELPASIFQFLISKLLFPIFQ